ncbi:MAG: ATP-binding protein [Patescibacteria group bacterium]|nr:ATP-binding protein [Patescibacteria group bacterium]
MNTSTKLSINTKSIRFRIFIWYAITLFSATAFIFASFYFVTRQILFSQVDKELSTHAVKLAEIATRQGVNMHEAMLKQQLYSEFSQIPGMVVVLLDKDGQVVDSSLTVGNPYDFYSKIFNNAQSKNQAVYLSENINNSPMRFIAEPIKENNSLLGVVLVAHPVDAIQKSLNSLLNTLGFVFLLLIFPTILGGKLLANKIMHPISKISDQMEKISSEYLDNRIDNPKTDDEIEKLTTTFNNLLDRMQESFHRERQFIGDVAHELKTPVATLRSEIELVLSKKRSEREYKRALEETLVDANRLSTIIKNILDLAWLQAENARLGEQHLNLSAVTAEIKEIAVKLTTQKQIKLLEKIEPNIEIMGDENKISRAILNIVDNSVKYTPAKGTVSIALYRRNKRAILEIKDTGTGISAKELPHIFERFYRGSKTAKTLGSGLGLAIAQGIIKAHHGIIKVVSKVGKGTSVIISLPFINPSTRHRQ